MSKNDMIIIQAILVQETEKAYWLNCEGNHEWFPKSQVNFNKDKEELEAPKWLLESKFPNEKF